MMITRRSPFTRKLHTLDIPVTEEQLERWHNGELIQNAMPDLTPDQREFLMTGITADEWTDVFGKGEEPKKKEPPSFCEVSFTEGDIHGPVKYTCHNPDCPWYYNGATAPRAIKEDGPYAKAALEAMTGKRAD